MLYLTGKPQLQAVNIAEDFQCTASWDCQFALENANRANDKALQTSVVTAGLFGRQVFIYPQMKSCANPFIMDLNTAVSCRRTNDTPFSHQNLFPKESFWGLFKVFNGRPSHNTRFSLFLNQCKFNCIPEGGQVVFHHL